MVKKEGSPLLWATELEKWIGSRNGDNGFPSPDLAELLVSHLCFKNNHPSIWKLLHCCLSSHLLSPLHVLALLSSKVIPHRLSHPEAYRLYLELLSHYALSVHPIGRHASHSQQKIIKSVDAALLLSQTYQVVILEPGHVLVLFFFSVLLGLIDSSFEDWGLQTESRETHFRPFITSNHQEMDLDTGSDISVARDQHRSLLRRENSLTAIKVMVELTEGRKAMRMLHLIHLNFPEKFTSLLQRLRFYEANKMMSSYMGSANQLLERLLLNIRRVCGSDYQLNSHRLPSEFVDVASCKPLPSCHPKSGQFACWVTFDIFMENTMDKQLLVRSAITMLTETIMTLKVLNQANWQETFLALWLSALRLVQRERDPLEGPLPHLESRLCILLTIVPLAIANIFNDQACCNASSVKETGVSGSKQYFTKRFQDSVEQGLNSSLQILGQFSGLLYPPTSVADAANLAAAKAARFLFNYRNGKSDVGDSSYSYTSTNVVGGNMRHLIVEACIARNLVDTSAYFWPNYVSPLDVSQCNSPPLHKSPWLTFIEGAPLDNSLTSLLLVTPSSSLIEIEKLYHIALNGSKEERPAAAQILCGASLSRGWNIQEHVVHYVVKLLSPPIPSTHSRQTSHLVQYMPVLSAILFGASSIDTVHVLSLHGMLPEVAGSLLPLCETFGSLVPTSSSRVNGCDEPSVYKVFSCAFLFLLRLWKFYRPPQEQCLNEKGGFGGELPLEYILLLRNSRIQTDNSTSEDEINHHSIQPQPESKKTIDLDFYPKLRAWYCQNKSCIASTLSGLSAGDPVREVANKVLKMIYKRIHRSGASSANSPSVSGNQLCGSPSSSGGDCYGIPLLPAWDVLEAMQYVLEALLTACAYERISSRDLTTGLRDLIDLLPASIGSIISYFSAEITRVIWKPVPMNGKDWPSPAAILPSIEKEMEAILANVGVGVRIPSLSKDVSNLTLSLPVSALVSLTITLKLGSGVDYIHAVVGPALENCASAGAWCSIPIISSLWAQKVRRWHHFIVVSCGRSIFRHNEEAVLQLLRRSCFSSFLGSPFPLKSSLTSEGGISSLLGHVIAVPGVTSPSVAPGFLFLRSFRSINIQCVNDAVIGLVAEFARQSAARFGGTDSRPLKSGQASLSVAMNKAKEVAMLGSSLLCVSGRMNLVQQLYRETIPTWLLSSREDKHGKTNYVSCAMEGYALAYMLVLLGSFVWGVGNRSPSWALSKRARIIGRHMAFMARVSEEKLSLGCDTATWKAYVCCFSSSVVNFAPAWIQDVELETLRKLADGLKAWNEKELALAILERGGIQAVGSAVELIHPTS